MIAEATSDVTLTVTLPSGTEAGEKVELYTFASNTYTPVSGHVAGAAKVVSGPEASAGSLQLHWLPQRYLMMRRLILELN